MWLDIRVEGGEGEEEGETGQNHYPKTFSLSAVTIAQVMIGLHIDYIRLDYRLSL